MTRQAVPPTVDPKEMRTYESGRPRTNRFPFWLKDSSSVSISIRGFSRTRSEMGRDNVSGKEKKQKHDS